MLKQLTQYDDEFKKNVVMFASPKHKELHFYQN
ncbi:hypothetical protein SDC9_63435 [bioreactor metagenome]|uniref:Uncharacterized protein n=1 Tax=bioreactor metagenome TaxID=1076179 RepID=A0A644XML9_9ZZZZ